MAFFYAPPPPSQGSASYTPPIPHEPQGSTGDQPPRRQVQAALAMAVVLASWPADLEPRLGPPNNQQQKIAPLTLTYGQQPSPRMLYVQPTASWGPEFWAAQHPPTSAANLPFVPPVIPDTVLAPRVPAAVLMAWNDLPEPEVVTTWTIAPDNPDPPPIQGPLTATELSLIARSWPTDWAGQHAPLSLAWNLPPSAYLANTPYPRAVRDAWEPLPPRPPALVSQVQPAAGDQPVPTAALSVTELSEILAPWQPAWSAQTGAKCAAWNFIPIPITARTPLPKHLWTAWEPLAPYPPRPVSIATALIPPPQNPPPNPPLGRMNLMIAVQEWAGAIWPAQFIVPTVYTPVTFRVEWAVNANQIMGPQAKQPETH